MTLASVRIVYSRSTFFAMAIRIPLRKCSAMSLLKDILIPFTVSWLTEIKFVELVLGMCKTS